MKSRRPSAPKSSFSPASKLSSSKALILVDSARIRAKAGKDYEKAKKQVEKARGEIERFESQDEPGFHRWMHLRFGPFLSRLRELHSELSELTV